jgi:hypothetical protein
VVEGRDPVRRDEQEGLGVDLVEVTDLAGGDVPIVGEGDTGPGG